MWQMNLKVTEGDSNNNNISFISQHFFCFSQKVAVNNGSLCTCAATALSSTQSTLS